MKETLLDVIGDMQRDISMCDDMQFKSMEEKQADKAVADALKSYVSRLITINGDATGKK